MTGGRGRRRADGRSQLRDRGGLGLRVPRGLERRRRDVGPAGRPTSRDKVEDHDDPVITTNGYDGTDTGMTGTTEGWADLTATVPDDATHVRFHYMTDGAAVESGFRVDNIADRRHRRSAPPRPDEGWVFDGLPAPRPVRTYRSTPTPTSSTTGSTSARDKIARPPVQVRRADEQAQLGATSSSTSPGALITYWDSSYIDNNVGGTPRSR